MPAVAAFAHKPTLEGEKVVLRPFLESDLPRLAEILADPEVLRLTASVHSAAEAEGQRPELDDRTRDWYLSRADQTDRLDLAVVDKGTGECVGEVVLNQYDAEDASCNFRTLIGPRGRGRGLGAEATRMIVDYGFDVVGLHRISLDVLATNPRAEHVYAKVGFVVEGRLRENFRYEDEWIDSILMAMLATDPRGR